MGKYRHFIIAVSILIFGHAIGQQSLNRVSYIPIVDALDKPYLNPLNGGMNTPIFNQIDLNRDGKKDLIVSVPASGTYWIIKTYIDSLGAYHYNPRYEKSFAKYPERFVIADLNCDGVEDMITLGSEAKIYIGKYEPTSRMFSFTFKTTIFGLNASNQYFTISNHPYSIPIVADIDQDGDIDFITLRSISEIYCLKSMQVEDNKSCTDSFRFSVVENWGSFNPYIDSLYTKPLVIRPRHSEYQSLWHLDVNRDGLIDVVISDEMYKNSVLGLNIGTPQNAKIIHSDTFFPSYSKSIDWYYSKGYWMDIDRDQKKDLVVTFFTDRDPTPQGGDTILNDDVMVDQIYKCFSSAHMPQSRDSFAPNGFLLSPTSIDVGSNSVPLIYDYNLDSLEDILIFNSWRITRKSRKSNLTLYRNIGTKGFPKYKLVSTDYLGLSQLNAFNIYGSAGDLNGDGRPDLLISYYDRATSSQQIKWYPAPIDSAYLLSKWIDIDLKKIDSLLLKYTPDLVPLIIDINNDQKLDLILSDQTYNVTKAAINIGSISSPAYSSSNVYKRYYKDLTNSMFNFSPFEYKDKAGVSHLMMSYLDINSYYTKVMEVDRYIGNLSMDSSIKPLSLDVFGPFIHKNMRIASADINHDSFPELIIGNYNGGIEIMTSNLAIGDTFYRPPTVSISPYATSDNESIVIYPNPTYDQLYIDLKSSTKAHIEVYDLTGRNIMTIPNYTSKEPINTHLWSNGVMLIQIIDLQGRRSTHKVSKESK